MGEGSGRFHGALQMGEILGFSAVIVNGFWVGSGVSCGRFTALSWDLKSNWKKGRRKVTGLPRSSSLA